MAAHSIPSLGRLQAVPLKEVWTSEPYAFDPWLIQPENLQFLAESIGLPGLELVRAQQPVGPFYADIVCKVIDSGDVVLIENQLDQADHRHLGQVLTYAPHVDAKICVWVAERIRDEHRAAVDWLNRITGEGYAFFGVEVRAVRIGDSLPAPLFEVVAKPNEWSKITTSVQGPAGSSPDSAASNLEYWPGLHQLLAQLGGPMRKVTTELRDVTYWAPIANSGRAYIWAFRSHSRNPYVNAGISLYNAGASAVWHKLKCEQQVYDARFGEPLRWHHNKLGTAFHIQTESRPSSLDESDWAEQHRWLVEKMMKFDAVFSSEIKSLIAAFDEGRLAG